MIRRRRTTFTVRFAAILACVALLAALAAARPPAAHAAPFTVNTTSITDDGTCNGAHCSIVEAVNAANGAGGPDVIAFNVGGGGVQTITPAADLVLTSPVTIDGTTQPGYAGTPLIEIASHGLTFQSTASGSLVRGLSITGNATSTDAGILVETGSNGNAFEANYIGLHPDGSVGANNYGIHVQGASNVIGGLSAAQRNVISGNSFAHVFLRESGSGNRVEGNYIGTAPDGMSMLASTNHGVIVRGDNHVIGGTSAAARNVIAVFGSGVFVDRPAGSTTDNRIEGNYIGLDAAGTEALTQQVGVWIQQDAIGTIVGGPTAASRNVISGNTDFGVRHQDGIDTVIQNNYIGVEPDGTTAMGNGDIPGDAGIYLFSGDAEVTQNIIAYSAGRGIRAASAANPSIRGNSIFLNDSLGIDIDDDGAADPPAGLTVTSATTSPGGTVISGSMTAIPSSTVVLDFYDSAACDPSGFGEGERYLGIHVFQMPGSGFTTFVFFTSIGVTPGRVVTATVFAATEFSSCVAVPPCGGASPDCDSFADVAPSLHSAPTNTNTSVDNCVGVWNQTQANTDGNFTDLTPPKSNDDLTWPDSDALGNDCDTDDDNDGRTDGSEGGFPYAPCPTASGPTNPLLRDTDGDRRIDRAECLNGSSPNDPASVPASGCTGGVDSDLDGLRDTLEFCFYHTNTLNTNSDGDACGDGREAMSMDQNTTVNAADLGLTASAFGSYGTPPTPGNEWRVNMDPDKNGVVNAADLGLVASKFGACP